MLEGVARALQLDEAERAHLFDLFRNTTNGKARRQPSQENVRQTVRWILDSMADVPAYVRNGRLDILLANRLGQALYAPVFDSPGRPSNVARFVFLDSNAPGFFPDWDAIAHDAVAILRAEAGRDPYDRRLTDLIGELSTRSEEFRVRWAEHNVKFHRTGAKRLHHPVVGDLTLAYEAFDLPGDSGQRLLAYTAEPGSDSHERLRLLASWSSAEVGEEFTVEGPNGGR